MSYVDDLNPIDISTEEIEEINRFVAEKMYYLSNPFGELVRLVKDQIIDLKPGDIFIGLDRWTKEPIIIRDEEISTHYCFVGATGSGKTTLAEDFISKLYYQQNNIFTCIIDIKGEWYESLLYRYGGRDFSHLKGRLFRLKKYEKGMIANLAREDAIVVFDFSSYSLIDDIIELYTQVRDFIFDIAEWIRSPKGDIQLNCLFEESALWFPNSRSEFNEIFTAYDDMINERETRAKLDLKIELANELVGIKDKDEQQMIKHDYKMRELELHFDRVWSFIKEIKSMAVSSILTARSRQCSIGFLVQRASLILTTIITQVGTKFIKRQTDKNDIDRVKATVGYLWRHLKNMRPNESLVVSPNYQSYCTLDRRTTHHVSENPKIKHYKSMVW